VVSVDHHPYPSSFHPKLSIPSNLSINPIKILDSPPPSGHNMPSRDDIFKAAKALCSDFASGKASKELLANFTSSPSVYEHGNDRLAPYMGRAFTGKEEVGRYFDNIAELLEFSDVHFADHDYVIDPESLKVAVRGRAKITWRENGQAWDESFMYLLSFATEDDAIKCNKYEVWADTGSAYLAANGKLQK
jgi:hypothetical protein